MTAQFELETVDSLLARNAIVFVPADLPPAAQKSAIEHLRDQFSRPPTNDQAIIPRKHLINQLKVIAHPVPRNPPDETGDVDFASDLVKWQFRGRRLNARFPDHCWNAVTTDLYSELCGRPSDRRGFHTLKTLLRDVQVTYTEEYGLTAEAMHVELGEYLTRERLHLRVGKVFSLFVTTGHAADDGWEEPNDKLYWFMSFRCIYDNGKHGGVFTRVPTGKTAPRPIAPATETNKE